MGVSSLRSVRRRGGGAPVAVDEAVAEEEAGGAVNAVDAGWSR